MLLIVSFNNIDWPSYPTVETNQPEVQFKTIKFTPPLLNLKLMMANLVFPTFYE